MRTSTCLRTAALLLSAGGALVLGLSGPLHAQDQAQGQLPQVLRGSAIGPAEAPPAAVMARSFEVAAGDELWLIDRLGGELIACELGPTTQVGRQEIRCWADDLPTRLD